MLSLKTGDLIALKSSFSTREMIQEVWKEYVITWFMVQNFLNRKVFEGVDNGRVLGAKNRENRSRSTPTETYLNRQFEKTKFPK